MLATITSKRQVTFPAAVLASLGVGPGDRIEIVSSEAGFLIRPRRIDKTRPAPLHGKLTKNRRAFDIGKFRQGTYDPALRD